MYDFDTQIDRRNTDSLKWNVGETELPMWVADMDFKAAPEIVEDIKARAAQGIFGYSVIPDEWRDAYIRWWKSRHHFAMERDWLAFCSGVIPAISTCVRRLTSPGDSVLVLTPVYNMFFHTIYDNGRNILESRLLYENGSYFIDFGDLEEKLAGPQTTMMILCNPHNPIGKIWDQSTLAKIGVLCAKHHVVVISDEIHCDLTSPGTEYVPFASVSEECRSNSITCIAPTKCFNLAGLKTAAVVVPNQELCKKVRWALNTDGIASPNSFAITAAVSAFCKGENWLDELNAYIAGNRKIVENFLKKELPGLTLVPGDATYLLWIDCRSITANSKEFANHLRTSTGLFLSEGKKYGGDGTYFVRLNIACPKAILADGLMRLKAGVESYQNK